MKLAVAAVAILISAGCCALITAILIGTGWDRTDALLGAIVYALAVIGAKSGK